MTLVMIIYLRVQKYSIGSYIVNSTLITHSNFYIFGILVFVCNSVRQLSRIITTSHQQGWAASPTFKPLWLQFGASSSCDGHDTVRLQPQWFYYLKKLEYFESAKSNEWASSCCRKNSSISLTAPTHFFCWLFVETTHCG